MPHPALPAARRRADHVRFRQASGAGRRGQISHDQPFEGNTLTSDRERYLRNLSVLQAAPEIAIEAPTIGWLKAALTAIERVGGRKIRAARPRAGADARGQRRSGRVERGDRGARHPPEGRLANRAAGLAPRDPARARHASASNSGRLRRFRSRRRAEHARASRYSTFTAAACTRGSPAATMRPPRAGRRPPRSMTMPPARSMIGIRGKMSNGFRPASTTRSIWPIASRQ